MPSAAALALLQQLLRLLRLLRLCLLPLLLVEPVPLPVQISEANLTDFAERGLCEQQDSGDCSTSDFFSTLFSSAEGVAAGLSTAPGTLVTSMSCRRTWVSCTGMLASNCVAYSQLTCMPCRRDAIVQVWVEIFKRHGIQR